MTSSLHRLAASALLVTSLAAKAQTTTPQEAPPPPPQPGFSLSVTTRIVVLDVVVTDKHGNLVKRADLTRDDFSIYEEGKPQKMRSFETPNAHMMPAGEAPIVSSAADLKKIGDSPVSVLVLDELNSRFEDMSYSRNSMIKYLQSQPPVLRQPTVLMVASNTTFQQMHDYTQDRDALIQVVKKHMPEYPWRMMGSGKSGPGAVERMAQVMAALLQISQASTGTPGRKNLIWVGSGFPSADLSGLDDKTAQTIEDLIKRVTDRMLAARITMYSINPAPGTTTTIDVESPDDLALSLDENGNDPFGSGQASFSTLATSTGGKAFQGRNDINNEIGEGIASGSFYYTMSYSPSNTADVEAKYRKLRIVMKDPSLRAITRDGYYPETKAQVNAALDKDTKPKQQQANLQMELSGALVSTIAYNGLSVSAKKLDNTKYQVKVDDAGLTWGPNTAGVEITEATLLAGWYSAKGKLLGHVARELTSTRGAGNSGATFTLPVTVPPDAARLRIVARDAVTGHMGTVDLTKF